MNKLRVNATDSLPSESNAAKVGASSEVEEGEIIPITDPKLFVWLLKEQELHKMAVDRIRKLGLEDMKRYSLDRSIITDDEIFNEYDWDDLGTACLLFHGALVKWSKMGVMPYFGRVLSQIEQGI
ncbi:hypothetical protein ACLB2K_047144 [Fragaria x ananassa]